MLELSVLFLNEVKKQICQYFVVTFEIVFSRISKIFTFFFYFKVNNEACLQQTGTPCRYYIFLNLHPVSSKKHFSNFPTCSPDGIFKEKRPRMAASRKQGESCYRRQMLSRRQSCPPGARRVLAEKLPVAVAPQLQTR